MTTEEFSNEFDTLVSSYMRFKAFDSKEELDSIEFNEFEKSQFLTAALEEIVKLIYAGKVVEGFEGTEELRRYLDDLIRYEDITLGDSSSSTFTPVTLKEYIVEFPTSLLFITYESVSFDDSTLGCRSSNTVEVVPIRQDELVKTVKNPFRGPSTSRVLRVDVGYREIKLLSKYSLKTYHIGYLCKPTPIILASLSGGLTIDGESNQSTCTLDSALHRVILNLAVLKALATKARTQKKE